MRERETNRERGVRWSAWLPEVRRFLATIDGGSRRFDCCSVSFFFFPTVFLSSFTLSNSLLVVGDWVKWFDALLFTKNKKLFFGYGGGCGCSRWCHGLKIDVVV